MTDIGEEPRVNEVSGVEETRKPTRGWRGWMTFVVIFGIVLPLAVYVFELTARICSTFFDPMPTPWHLALLLTIPLSGILVLRAYLRQGSQHMTALTFIAGLAIGTSLIYCVQLIPLTPLSISAVVLYGFGLLGLSPYFAFASTIICSQRLRDLQRGDDRQYKITTWCGVIVAVLILGGYAISCEITRVGMHMASSTNEARSLRGVRLLRVFGNRSAMLRTCYQLPVGFWGDINFFGGRTQIPNAQQSPRNIYYRVTGDPFNSVPPPHLVGSRASRIEDFDFDSDIGGTSVNGITRNLSLYSSHLDATVDPDALTAYTEWTMTFANSAQFTDKEARAEIALPPGGVVSRVTLWVNDKPREAAFSARGQVRAAYQKVAVAQRRDPVLVTTCGPDRILVQCFPVRAGKKMRVRIGITSPLMPDSDMKATLNLPHFVERNFGVASRHAVFVDSDMPISFGGKSKPAKAIRAALSDRDLNGTRNALVCSRNPKINTVSVPDPTDPKHYEITQVSVRLHLGNPENLIIVLDSSKRVADSRAEIVRALRSIPKACSFTLIQAGDEVTELTPLRRATAGALKEAEDKVGRMRCVGGIDNRAALLKACQIALSRGNSQIIWIHGPQPLTSDDHSEELLQLINRHPGRISILSVPAEGGHNSVLADIEQTGAVSALPRTGTLSADLKHILNMWDDSVPAQFVTLRIRNRIRTITSTRSQQYIAVLWVRNEVKRLCRAGGEANRLKAVKLAAEYHIVTPVSGAVVLETAEQYKEAGLKPIDTNSPIATPEPATWAALAMGVSIMALFRRRKQTK